MNQIREAVLELPVFDTHTHLNNPGVPIPARDFWDIGHYFWFLRELIAAGYPGKAADLPEDRRREHYARAYAATRNTSMHWVVKRIFQDLYGLEITDASSIQRADEAVKASFAQAEWPRKVIDRLAIRRIGVNSAACADFKSLEGVGYAIPSLQNTGNLVPRILNASDSNAELAKVQEELRVEVAAVAARGFRGVRTDAAPFDRLGQKAYSFNEVLPKSGVAPDHVLAMLCRSRFQALSEKRLFAQYFLGIHPTTIATAMPQNDTNLLPNMHRFFEQYNCDHELLLGCELSNLDIVQAACVLPNVQLGGLWWFNFRASTYRQCMQYRLEALPPSRSAIVASDARCIEWCYGKILLVKHLLAEFLDDQISRGWLDMETALFVAREWLHDSVERRYIA